MRMQQTSYFIDDIKHYYNLAKEHIYTSNAGNIRKSLYKLDKIRGAAYCDQIAAKVNQKLKKKFYYREA